MQPKILSKQVLVISILLGLVLFVALLLNFIPKISNSDLLASDVDTQSKQQQTNLDLPVRLKISSIGVDAKIEYVGLTSDGAMDVPKNPDNVAWFNLGVSPGENGSAVIAGHFGWKNNTPAVFDNLHKLSVGDKILVEDESGITTIFIVRKMIIYDKDDIVPEVFSSNDGKAHLNLITCTGTWNKQNKTFSERLVVFTDKE